MASIRNRPQTAFVRMIEAQGYRVIRIWNNDVIENVDGVLAEIVSELRQAGGG